LHFTESPPFFLEFVCVFAGFEHSSVFQ
jgi:hypothetical protein